MPSVTPDTSKEHLDFYCLGGGNEVGRSCHIVEYKGKVVMLDAGVHPAYSGIESLPFYDDFDLSRVDVLLISHFHLDHAASLPYVMQHTNFKGRVFMTYPTKAIYKWLLNDFVRVTTITDDSNGMDDNSNAFLYTGEDLNTSLDRIETLDYHSTVEVDGIRFTAYPAGHVLGAAMFLVEMGGLKYLFTGDYSREEDRHLSSAEVPNVTPDMLICESTFGTATHVPRLERETKLTTVIHSTLQQGGRCLLPVFALGRAQEILLILDEYWQQHKDLQSVPIYYASDLAKKCMAVYQRYVNMMNESIRKKFTETNENPFHFKFVKNVTHIDRVDDLSPCVMIASPGMLQNGISRLLLEKWCPDPRNTVVMTGYSVDGTMAKQLLTEPDEIPSLNNPDVMIPRRVNVEEISFAAHVDYEQNSEFIDKVNAKTIVLVHGESNPMGRLKSALLSKYQKYKDTENEVKVYNPRDGTKLELEFKGVKISKVMGQLATELPKEHNTVSGVLVQKNFDLNLLKVDDLREFTGLTATVVRERQTLRCNSNRNLLRWQFLQMFGYIKILADVSDEFSFQVMDVVTVTLEESASIATVEWQSGIIDDTVADSAIAIIMSCDSLPASVKISSKSHNHEDADVNAEEVSVGMEDIEQNGQLSSVKREPKIAVKEENYQAALKKLDGGDDDANEHHENALANFPTLHNDYSPETRLHHIEGLLKVQFGDSFTSKVDDHCGIIKIGRHEAKINYKDFTVVCQSNVLKGRVEGVLHRSLDLVAPLSHE
ncbi:hypothetical protein FOA43_003647 [Brettanomyces nanus]|uniref:Endoribonuclease YSH1 n=1 Tax=Eeniella nana TaxID=13502 RepID=A0A875S3K0_EENNA|nr:uncharacterized protein FOA43_003647 [Brettanomyces nanus]QPG76261.1 hypothetical protein FOA43_003647 [Brettanomyces nanus]